MSLKLGYLVGSLIFAMIFIGLVWGQVKAERFRPILYWATIIATTMLGTTMADFADRSIGLGYPGGVVIVSLLAIASLSVWYWSEGTVSVQSIVRPKVEWFYWVTILFSQTLGTALGDWVAGPDRGGLGLGYEYGALIFGAGSGDRGSALLLDEELRTRCSSGPPSCSPGRSGLRSATCSTSPWPVAV